MSASLCTGRWDSYGWFSKSQFNGNEDRKVIIGTIWNKVVPWYKRGGKNDSSNDSSKFISIMCIFC